MKRTYLILFTMFLSLTGQVFADDKPPKAMPVPVIEVKPQTVEMLPVYSARTESSGLVEVRSRVDGLILERQYNEGGVIKKGDPLFLIDPEPYQVSLELAQASLARVQATLKQAERNWSRVSRLYKQKAISERDRDAALSQLELAQAEIRVAEATVKEAQLKLDYTKVAAPLSGIAGLEIQPVGSLVSEQQVLATITKLDPIQVMFSVPEAQVMSFRKLLKNGSNAFELPVDLMLTDNQAYAQQGVIDYTDAVVDKNTGTVRFRAVFPNSDYSLLPGQFVRVRVRDIKLSDAIVVPEKVILQTPNGAMIYVVNDKNIVEPRIVPVGEKVADGIIIPQGLSAGDKVITAGLIKIRPGMAVVPMVSTPEK